MERSAAGVLDERTLDDWNGALHRSALLIDHDEERGAQTPRALNGLSARISRRSRARLTTLREKRMTPPARPVAILVRCPRGIPVPAGGNTIR